MWVLFIDTTLIDLLKMSEYIAVTCKVNQSYTMNVPIMLCLSGTNKHNKNIVARQLENKCSNL